METIWLDVDHAVNLAITLMANEAMYDQQFSIGGNEAKFEVRHQTPDWLCEAFLDKLDSRPMSSWSDVELNRYAVLTGQGAEIVDLFYAEKTGHPPSSRILTDEYRVLNAVTRSAAQVFIDLHGHIRSAWRIETRQ